MVKEYMFSSGMKKFRCGMVRITRDFRIIDKNTASERLIQLPRRGASILPVLGESGKNLGILSYRTGASCVVNVTVGNRRLNATAIREEDGNILIFFHPLLSMLRFAENASKKPKIPMYFMQGLLDSLYNCSEKDRLPETLMSEFGSIDFSVRKMMFTEEVMKKLADKLNKTDLVRPMTVRFESRHPERMFLIDFQTAVYAFSELLSVDSVLAGEGRADVRVISDQGGLLFILSDTCPENRTRADETYLKVTESILKLTGAWMQTEKYGDRRIVIKITVPVKPFSYRLRTPEIYAEEALWAYFEYALSYYLMGDPLDETSDGADD